MAKGRQVRSSKPKEQRKARQAGTAIIWTSEITSAASIALGDGANENDGAAASRQPTSSSSPCPEGKPETVKKNKEGVG
ncbi:hypothetical protein ElyMa_002045000 [Elysia marginata]|uniref:Uncharacterized protein n=1 Tax=Elysia marginata TaxID=1093978 RepID=A0AAV4F854_9GAST|nr:hypothetical protein ElyMa_002045000 [Elysia marginata]